MQKQQFENMIGREVSDRDFSIIEYVAKWHPSMPEENREACIANLYTAFGMDMVRQLHEAAACAEQLETEKHSLIQQLNHIDDRIRLVGSGILTNERCRNDLKQMHAVAKTEGEWNTMLQGLYNVYGMKVVKDICEELALRPPVKAAAGR